MVVQVVEHNCEHDDDLPTMKPQKDAPEATAEHQGTLLVLYMTLVVRGEEAEDEEVEQVRDDWVEEVVVHHSAEKELARVRCQELEVVPASLELVEVLVSQSQHRRSHQIERMY